MYEHYGAVKAPFYSREFPTSWRDIDKGVEDLAVIASES
jgi:hypothetical protein